MNIPLTRNPVPRLFETSAIAPANDIRNQTPWRYINQANGINDGVLNQVAALSRAVGRIRRPLISDALHPFAIVPTGCLMTSTTGAPDAVIGYTFRVHGGHVLGVGYAPGTDGSTVDMQTCFTDFASGFDIAMPWVGTPLLPATLYVWLEWTGNNARVLWGPDPTATSYSDIFSPTPHSWNHAAAPWTGVGAWTSVARDGNHAMIGIVDASVGDFQAYVYAGDGIGPIAPIIRQYLNGDFDPSGGAASGFATFAFQQMSENSADCVQAYPYDTGTGTIIYSAAMYDVALPWELRPSQHASETIDDVGTVAYTYTIGSQKRQAYWTDSGNVSRTTFQKITPQLIVGQVFRAFNVGTMNNGAGPTWPPGFYNRFTQFEMVPRFWAWNPALTS
jgi:hypothetical protein